MARYLADLENDIDRRFALYRRMAYHAGLDLYDETVPIDPTCLRSALLACASCGNVDLCEAWLASGRAGAPAFCRARFDTMIAEDCRRAS